MSKKEKPVQDGELSEQQLDKVAGGQEVRKMRPLWERELNVILNGDVAGTKLAQADSKTKKN